MIKTLLSVAALALAVFVFAAPPITGQIQDLQLGGARFGYGITGDHLGFAPVAPVKKTASPAAPNWSGSLAYDLKTKQFATLAQTSLKSFGAGSFTARWTAFAGQEIQNPLSKGSGGSIAGTGFEVDSMFKVQHTQLFFNLGLCHGFVSGSDGSHWLALFGVGIAFTGK